MVDTEFPADFVEREDLLAEQFADVMALATEGHNCATLDAFELEHVADEHRRRGRLAARAALREEG